MARIGITALAFLAVSSAARAQQVGGDVSMGGLTNGNFQNGVAAAVSQGAVGSNNTTTATGGSVGNTTAAGGAGGQGGAATARGQGGAVTNNIAGGNVPSTIRNTPSVALALATAYCANSGGATGSGPGFSFGLAFGKHDIDCKRVNFALLLEGMGRREEALLVLANNREVSAAIVEANRQREAVRAASLQQPPRRGGVMVPAGSLGPSPADCRAMGRALRETRRRTDASAVASRDYYDAHCVEAELVR